ncbi:hypothetical protein DES53_11615 [Roseimicrobium gellanilyticum]|uniref:Uncharacterized protein n=1 Tax=Roseimicrobium gellanilyticum TaxID=748857 RepID=A0A366H3X9_9BACT|nr:hypothetical protein [Roseimicrobium gellanilyticum]RBP36576.1 hypothetical protein DES53_11615 [Roseimicrobium gellanilyticum]
MPLLKSQALKTACALFLLAFLGDSRVSSEIPALVYKENADPNWRISKVSMEDLSRNSQGGWTFSSFLKYSDWREVAAQREELRKLVQERRGSNGFLPLMLLLAQREEVAPDIQAQILTAWLSDFEDAEDWLLIQEGTPTIELGFAAEQLVKCGRIALQHLLPLMQKRVAIEYSITAPPNSNDLAIQRRLRKCDIAYAVAAEIAGQPWKIESTHKERDAAMNVLVSKLQAQGLVAPLPNQKVADDGYDDEVIAKLAWISLRGALFAFDTDVKLQDVWKQLEGREEKLRVYVVAHPGTESLLALFYLHLKNKEKAKEVDHALTAQILCAFLGDFDYVDDYSWSGMDGTEWQDLEFGKLLLASGKDALPYLLPLLSSQIPVSYTDRLGTEAGMAARRLRLRKCDVVSRYVAIILGRPWSLDETHPQRDTRIQELLSEVKKLPAK